MRPPEGRFAVTLITVPEAAARLRLSKTALRDVLMKQPGFPSVRMPGVRRVFVDADALGPWLASRQSPSHST